MSVTYATPDSEKKNYLCVVCNFCKKEMILDEQSVIFGSNWYHMVCFIRADIESKISDVVRCQDGT